MPLTGVLLADFTAFRTAAQQAELSLKGMETGAGRVATSLSKMGESFSGRKMIQDATLMTEAVNRLKDQTGLTEAEQRKVNAALTEAIAKYNVLGEAAKKAIGPEAIASMRKLEEETRKAAQTNTDTTGTFGKLNAGLGAVGLSLSGLGIAAVSAKLIGMGKDAIESAGHLKDLAAATGISTTSLQRLQYAGSQVGVSLDELTTGVQRMQRNLVEGDKSAVGAVTRLGLSVDTLLKLNPAEAFETISSAVAKIPDPAQRTAIAMELLGRSGANLLPLMTADVQELEAGFQGMSEEAINGLDALGDAFETWKLRSKASIGEAINAMTSFQGAMQAIMDRVIPFRAALRQVDEGMKGIADRAAAAAPDLTKGLVPKGPDLGELERQADAITATLKKQFSDASAAAKRAQEELAQALKRSQEAFQDWEARVLNLSNVALATFIGKIGQATMSMPAHLIALQEITKAERELSPAVEDAARSMLEAGIKADRVFAALKAGKQVTDEDREAVDRLAQSVKEMSAAQDRWNEMLGRSTVGLGGLFKVLKDLGTQAEMSKPPTADYEKFRGAVGDLTRAFGLLAQISGDSWGGVIKDIATAVASMQTALETVKAIEQAMQSLGVLKAKYNPSTGKMEPGTFGPMAQGVIGTSIVGYTVGSSVVGATDIRKGATGAAAGAAAGAGAGALYGSVVPVIGTGIGAAVGAIAGAIGGYFAARKAAKELRDANNEASKAIADMQKQLVSQYGPLQNIDKLGKQVGVDLAGAWGDQSIEGLKNFQALTTEFQEKIQALQDAVQEFGLTWKDLGKEQQLSAMQEQADKLVQKFDVLEKAGYDMGVVTAKSAGALLSLLGDIAEVGGKIPDNLAPALARLGGLKTISDDNAAALNKYIGTAIGSGAKIPAALQPIIEKLIRMGKLTEENAKALLGMSSEALPALDDIKAAADRYGLSLEQVGGKAEQMNIDAQAKQAVADWELLTSLGGNFGAVMAAMAPQVQSIVSDAKKYGLTLSESMKPMIQAMIEAGQLTDDTGQKLTDISQLDFAADPAKKTQELIDKLGGFIDVLTGGEGVTDNLKAMSGDAKEAFGGISDDAKKAADAIKKEFSGLSFTIPITYDFTNAGSPTGGATGYAAGGTVYARGGWPWMPKGSDTVPAMLTPGERVLSLAETAKYDALMSGGSYRPPGPIIIKTYLNSRQIAEEVVPEIPGVVKRYGLTR